MLDLSVIVATRNNAQWIGQCLDSLLSQRIHGMEILVVDDASTDGSREIIDKYISGNSDQLRTIYMKRQIGVARARDRGIREARGKFISTLDGDDFLCHPEKLARELDLAGSNSGENGKTAAFSGIRRVDATGNPLHPLPHTPEVLEGHITRQLLERSCFIPRDFTFDRDIYFRVGGYDPGFSLYEDWDLKVRLSTLVEYRFTGIEGIAYRRHGAGLSSRPVPDHLRYLHRGFRKNRILLPPKQRRRAARTFRSGLVGLKRRAVNEYLENGNHPARAWIYLMQMKWSNERAPRIQTMLKSLLRLFPANKDKS